MTYSILGFDPDTGDIGIAVQSKFPNVGGLVPYARADIGAVATQAFGNPRHAEQGLILMSQGASPEEALAILLRADPERNRRQVGLINADGVTATFTGAEVREWGGWAGGRTGRFCVAQGNALVAEDVVQAMTARFETTDGPLAERLITALSAGEAAGGELRGQQSAALLVVRAGGGYGGFDDRLVTISIYDHATPIDELARCYHIHGLSYFPSDPANLRPIDGRLAIELKCILKSHGFYDGAVDETWDETAVARLKLFMGWANYDNRLRDDAQIDLEVLEDMRAKYA